MTEFKNIAIMTGRKGGVSTEAVNIIRWLAENNYHVMLPEGKGEEAGFPQADTSVEDIKKNADLMISLGGDGTMIHASKLVAGTKIPILGVNLGHLGFLTEFTAPDYEGSLQKILKGHFKIVKHMMLDCRVIRNGQVIFSGMALNDAVVHHGGEMQLLRLSFKISNMFAGSYSADGVIISTPLGSCLLYTSPSPRDS